ncbi:MAG: tetratricopeptide repeat protein, partial [Actinobacteria bacterium]|nr:tetratricopeptide repeat protein [Actinomycetota bacterium]
LAPDGVPRRLPADTRVFTGRHAELARLLELAGRTGDGRGPGTVVISAIDGMAGIGKTALAVHAAHLLAERFGDGQLFIDLHGYTEGYPPRTPDQALETFLRTLGVPAQQVPADPEERAALYRERLAGTRTLIVLDNAADEAQVRPLIPGESRCLVLVTSRRKLKALDDAHTMALDVLPVPAAIALFAAVAGPGRVQAEDPVAAEIAGLCGRLPLTVRIAAALLRNRPAWTPEDLAGTLRAARARLDAFADGDRDLAALFDLSSQALDDGHRRLYCHLGHIPGPEADVYAAAALLDTGPVAAKRLLQGLVDQNLLQESPAGRYRMHDLVRAHARAQALPAPEREAATGRLLDYYQHTAGRADARITRSAGPGSAASAPAHAPALPDAGAARAWLRAERANLTACLHYAIRRGQDDHTVALSQGLASLFRMDGPWPQAIDMHTAAAAAAARIGDRSGQALALTELGYLRQADDYLDAERSLRSALRLYQAAGDPSGQARALTELGVVGRLSGDYRDAERSLQSALRLYRAAGDPSGQARAL